MLLILSFAGEGFTLSGGNGLGGKCKSLSCIFSSLKSRGLIDQYIIVKSSKCPNDARMGVVSNAKCFIMTTNRFEWECRTH